MTGRRCCEAANASKKGSWHGDLSVSGKGTRSEWASACLYHPTRRTQVWKVRSFVRAAHGCGLSVLISDSLSGGLSVPAQVLGGRASPGPVAVRRGETL